MHYFKAVEMKKAIFLDRDGVINDDRGHYYIFRIEQFRINEGIIEALHKFQEKGYLLIVISNQGGISRNQYTKADTDRIHRHLVHLLRDQGITVTDILYCPHHDSIENCLCRKPKPLMLQKAMARYGINPEISYFIGDKETDIKAGREAGLHTIRVDPNSNIQEIAEKIN
jgi:D-glycero-D-manno-heptose 1,7-bisphosphate phosphatase